MLFGKRSAPVPFFPGVGFCMFCCYSGALPGCGPFVLGVLGSGWEMLLSLSVDLRRGGSTAQPGRPQKGPPGPYPGRDKIQKSIGISILLPLLSPPDCLLLCRRLVLVARPVQATRTSRALSQEGTILPAPKNPNRSVMFTFCPCCGVLNLPNKLTEVQQPQ